MSDRSTAVYDDLAIEPDLAFERDLRDRLETRMRQARPSRANAVDRHIELRIDAPAPIPTGPAPLTIERQRGRRSLLAVAAAIAASVAVGFVGSELVDDESDPPAQTVAPPTTVAPVTLPPATTTTTDAPITMDELTAIRGLMWTDDYFIPGFEPVGPQPVTLDGSVAAELPACQPFLDTVFESEARPATVGYKAFGNEALDIMMFQYIVVHPTSAQAAAMLDGMQDPAFVEECIPAYETTRPVQCCDEVTDWVAVSSGDGELEPPVVAVDTDDAWVRRYRLSWIDDQGVPRGPVELAYAAIRVDNIVTSIEVLLTDKDGRPVASISDFQSIVQNLANRAEIARHGP
jgi:hypothetical protein